MTSITRVLVAFWHRLTRTYSAIDRISTGVLNSVLVKWSYGSNLYISDINRWWNPCWIGKGTWYRMIAVVGKTIWAFIGCNLKMKCQKNERLYQAEILEHSQHLEAQVLGSWSTSSWPCSSPCRGTTRGRTSPTAPGSSSSWWSRPWSSTWQPQTRCTLLENTG